MNAIDKGAVVTAVAIAALSALLTGGIDLAFEEARRRLDARRERNKGGST